MRISISLALLAASALVTAAVAASPREPVDSVPGVEDGPALSPSAENMTNLGFASPGGTMGGKTTEKAGKHLVTYTEEDANGNYVHVTIDTMTGEVQPAHPVQQPPKP